MKKLYLFVIAFILSMTAVVYADGGVSLVDEVGYLTPTEAFEVESKLDEIKNRTNIDVAVVTVKSTGGKSAMAYADDYYDYNGYGMGINDDGILLLICEGTREYHFTTHAKAIEIFSESALDYLESEVVYQLSNDNYYEAFLTFAETAEEIILTYEETGESYGISESESVAIGILGYVFIISLFIAIIMTVKASINMNTARKGTEAELYIKQGSMNVTRSKDIFLYSNVVKTKIESSSGSSGGRTHRSSSGRSHGGRGGRF